MIPMPCGEFVLTFCRHSCGVSLTLGRVEDMLPFMVSIISLIRSVIAQTRPDYVALILVNCVFTEANCTAGLRNKAA